MKNKLFKPSLFLIFLIGFTCQSFAKEADSDSLCFERYLDAATLFSKGGQDDSVNYYFNNAADLINNEKLDDVFKAKLEVTKSQHFFRVSNYSDAVAAMEQAIVLYREIGDKKEVAQCYNRLGTIHRKQSKNDEALNSFNQSAKVYSSLNDSLGMASVELNVGNVLKQIGQTEMAKKKYFHAVSIYKKRNHKIGIASCYNNLGNIHKNDELFDSAFYYMYKTLEIRLEIGETKGLAYIYNNLSNLHKVQANQDSALYYLKKSIVLKEEIGDKADLCQAYRSLSVLYFEQNNFSEAYTFIKKAEELLNPEMPESLKRDVYKTLGDLHFEMGKYKMASEYFRLYHVSLDSLEKNKSDTELMFELMRFESLSDSLAKDKLILSTELENLKIENKNLQFDNEKRKFYYLIVVLGIILLMGALLLISFRRRLHQSSEHQTILAAQNEELKRTLISKDEKEVLLKEVHHRVKNNLQIINSLIRLQSNFINQSNYNEKLKDTENRIRSMALIHEKLYKSQNLAKLDIRNYIEELCFTIMETYENNVKIKFNFDIQEKEFGIDTLIPLGLIINELLSNSIKYAFEGREEGYIEIKLSFDETTTILKIKDNGMGADLTWEELKDDSLGLDLVESLTDQLDGVMTLDTNEGFDFNFTFPLLS